MIGKEEIQFSLFADDINCLCLENLKDTIIISKLIQQVIGYKVNTKINYFSITQKQLENLKFAIALIPRNNI